MIILVDMDGVIANFESNFLKQWREQYPGHPYIPLEERVGFYVEEQYPADIKHLVAGLFRAPNFYRTNPPIPGGLQALNEMRDMGHEVFICTSPLTEYQNCVLEKYEWVDQHLGLAWVDRIVLTRDKTLVNGDILIDDRPHIDGAAKPTWEHVLYDQPYNRSETGKRRLTWDNWRTVLFDEPIMG
ncbi:MAG: 5'-3'-deoxyribonucleotidase [Anaerolineae bacterium]|nr:5'-3'-deoxyribonucleotidase [Anaerolineae bacterium]